MLEEANQEAPAQLKKNPPATSPLQKIRKIPLIPFTENSCSAKMGNSINITGIKIIHSFDLSQTDRERERERERAPYQDTSSLL